MDNSSEGAKILIVDDDPEVKNFLGMFLRLKGYPPARAVEKGLEALEIIRKEDIKLVLLDIMLPDLSGLEVLRRMKAIKENISVIMITGYPDEGRAEEAMKNGAYDYIVKPFDLNYLELSVLSKIAALI